jgi:cytochrome P450
VDSSVGGSIAHDLHRRRRQALDPFFSASRVARTLQPLLDSKASQVEDVFEHAGETGQVLNLSDLYFAFANDIVHAYCFGSDPEMVDDLALAHTRRENIANVLQSVKVMLHFGWIRDVLGLLPKSIAEKATPPGVRDMIAFRRDIRTRIEAILNHEEDAKAKEDAQESIFTHLRDSEQLPPVEKTAQRLEDEAVLMTMAGTYSPMLSLLTVHYHLLADPALMARLRAELAANQEMTTAAQLAQLPFIAALTQEAHRLTFGLTGRNARVCPDESLVYTDTTSHNGAKSKSYILPPGTSLSTSTLLIHTDESVFGPDPWRFDPDRWLVDDPYALAIRRRGMLSFMRGPRQCVGMHLANAEMAIALASMARWEMRLFETDEGDVEMRHDYHVLCPKLRSKGVRVEVLGPAKA